MGRPPSGLDDYLDWQERLERHQTSDEDLRVFCLQEGVSRSTFYRWKKRLKDGVPEPIKNGDVAPDQARSNESVFIPISLKGTPVEIELPNGGVVRLPLEIGRSVLVAIVRVVGSLQPWKAPPS